MRILDKENDQPLSQVEIYLTESEAAQLLADLHSLVNSRSVSSTRLPDKQFDHEIFLYKYSEAAPIGLTARQKRLITDDV